MKMGGGGGGIVGFLVVLGCCVCVCEGLLWMTPRDGMDGFADLGNDNLNKSSSWDDVNRLSAQFGMLGYQSPLYFDFRVTSRSQKVIIKLYKASNSDEEGFSPGMTIMGPGTLPLESIYQTDTPNYVEIPLGFDDVTIINRDDVGSGIFNALPPYGYYETVAISLFNARPGIYFVAVFSSGTEGHYALSLGEVEWFTFTEFLLGPFYAIEAWQWMGQNLALALLPIWFTILGGFGILIWQGCYHRHSPKTWFNWVTCTGGFVVLASPFVVIQQLLIVMMSIENLEEITDVWATAFWFLCPLGLGFSAIFLGLMSHVNKLIRFLLMLIALLSVMVWAGYFAGPFFILLGALLPSWDIPWYRCLPWFKSPHEEEEGAAEDPNPEIKDLKDEEDEPLLGEERQEAEIELEDVAQDNGKSLDDSSYQEDLEEEPLSESQIGTESGEEEHAREQAEEESMTETQADPSSKGKGRESGKSHLSSLSQTEMLSQTEPLDETEPLDDTEPLSE